MLAREDRRRAGDSHDELWLGTIGERGSDVVDDRLFRRADKSCRTDDDLNDVHGSLGALVQVDAEVAGEVVDRQAATVERLQHQDLLDRGLSGRVRRCAEHQAEPVSARRRNLRPGPVVDTKQRTDRHQVFALCKDIHLPSNHEIVARCGPVAFLRGRLRGRTVRSGGIRLRR